MCCGGCVVFFFMLMLAYVWLEYIFYGLFCIVDGCGSVCLYLYFWYRVFGMCVVCSGLCVVCYLCLGLCWL